MITKHDSFNGGGLHSVVVDGATVLLDVTNIDGLVYYSVGAGGDFEMRTGGKVDSSPLSVAGRSAEAFGQVRVGAGDALTFHDESFKGAAFTSRTGQAKDNAAAVETIHELVRAAVTQLSAATSIAVYDEAQAQRIHDLYRLPIA